MAENRKFTVDVYQKVIASFTVEADSIQGAIEAYEQGEWEFAGYAEYTETLTQEGLNGIRSVDDSEGDEIMWEDLKAMEEAEK